MFGEYLYQLNHMERVSAPVVQRTSAGVRPDTKVSALTTTVQSLPFVVPPDKCAFIVSLYAEAKAGAAQTVDRIQVSLNVDNSLATIAQVGGITNATPGLRLIFAAYPAHLLLMPNESLTAFAYFSAAANANEISLHVVALLLPKANLQLR